MAVSSRPPANGFVAVARKVYNPIGFAKGYNAVLWFIFSGALLGFCLARATYLDFHRYYCGPNIAPGDGAAPGECFSYYKKEVYRIGIMMHLWTIIPAGLLAVFQFVPFIRHKAILIHRINGYIVLLLSLASIAGAIMIAPVAFGGSLHVRVVVGLSAIMFVGSLGLALWNIKVLQLEQHRAWMLRAWFYVSTRMRLIEDMDSHISV